MKRTAFLPALLLMAAACRSVTPAAPTETPQPPTATATSSPTENKPPTATLTPTGSEPVYVLAFCTLMGRERRQSVPAGRPVILYWGWSAATMAQIEDYFQAGKVVVTFDTMEIRGVPKAEIPFDESRKIYIVTWLADIGAPSLGIHVITYTQTFSRKIFDGMDYYGPGTKNEMQKDECEISVDG
jgi:hypothetical protein